MENNFVPYLCGGIFFSFLIDLRDNTAEKYHEFQKKKKKRNQHDMMKELIYAIYPDYSYNATAEESTFKRVVSEYHTCKINGGKILPFERDVTRTEFDKYVREQYGEVLKRMTTFTTAYFPTCNDTAMRILVQRTLILIRDDNSIDNDTPFFIQPDGSPISKEELLKKEDFNFQSFLVGIWHYIITKPTKNEDGIQTFENLFPKYDGKERKLDISCLKPYAHNINVTWTKTEKSLSKENYEDGNMVESSKTDKKELAVKIYYEGSLLEDEEKNKILSCDPAIIDLNENPDIDIKNMPNSTIYKVTTDFQFESYFPSPMKEIVRLYWNIASLNVSGFTTPERWTSESLLNRMCFRGTYTCTAWFTLTPSDEEYDAYFLIIGEIIQ